MRDYTYKEMAFVLSTLLKLDYAMLSVVEREVLQKTISLLEVLGNLQESEESEEEDYE